MKKSIRQMVEDGCDEVNHLLVPRLVSLTASGYSKL